MARGGNKKGVKFRGERLTKKVIENTDPGGRRITIWDSEVRGLGVRISPPSKRAKAGTPPRRTFVLDYWSEGGTHRRMALGLFGSDLTIAQARALARKRLAEVAEGGDPLDSRKEARKSMTMAELCDEWLEEVRGHKKQSSLEIDELYIRKYVKPALGSRKVDALTLKNVETLHKKIGKDTPIMANRVVSTISACLTLAERNGLRPQGSNVCKQIRRFPEKERHRALSELELRRLAKVLDEWPTRKRNLRGGKTRDAKPKEVRSGEMVADIIRVIILTGCRRSEIAHLLWSEVDTERRVLRLKDSKSGPRIVYLNTPAIEILDRQERMPLNPYVFASLTKQGAPLSDLKRSWRGIREKACLGNCRIHDLRHHAGENFATLGFNEAYISKLLGHKDPNVTRRYIDVAMSPLHDAAERYGDEVARVFGRAEGSEEATADGDSGKG